MTYVAETDGAMRRVLANAAVLLSGRAASAVMSLGTMALTARTLGVTNLGVLVLVQAFAQFLGETAKFKSWQTILHYGTKPFSEGRRQDFQRVMRFSMLLDVIGSSFGVSVGLIATLCFGEFFGVPPEDRYAAALYMVSVAFMVSATPTGLLRLFDRFDVLARQLALIGLVRLIGSALAFAAGASTHVFLAVWAGSIIAGFVYITAKVASELNRHDMLRNFQWGGGLTTGMPGAWRFAWSTNLSATLDVAFTHVVTLAIGGLIGPAEAAFWRVGKQVSTAIAKPARLLTTSLYPELARLRAQGSGDGQAMWRLARRIGVMAGALGLAVLALGLGAGHTLLTIVIGRQFAPAAALMNWQVAASVIGLFALPLEPILIAHGLAHTALKVRFIVCLVYLVSLGPIISRFGATGAAASLVVASLAMALGMLWAVLYLRSNRPRLAAPDEEEIEEIERQLEAPL